MTHIILENVYCLTGGTETKRTVRVAPANIPPGKFLFCCLAPGEGQQFLKLRFQLGSAQVPMGRASAAEYLRQAQELGLCADWCSAAPPNLHSSCILHHPDLDTLSVEVNIDTNHPDFVRTAQENQPRGFSIPVQIYLLAAPTFVEPFTLTVSVTPASDVPAFRGAVGLDLGNHNSTVAGYERGRTEKPLLVREGAVGRNATVDSSAPAVPSVVKLNSIHPGVSPDSLSAIDWRIGEMAQGDARISLEGIELAAKKLIFSPRFQEKRHYTVFDGPRNAAARKTSMEVPLRLPGELLACRLLQQFREATRAFPKQIAVSYPTMYAEREVLRLREVVHRAWLRLQNKAQDAAALAPVRSAFTGPARMTDDDEGILLMLDEASAAAFFFLFQRLLDKPGQLAKFRYLYPHGLNLLLFDCGGGTTDIALVRALVRPTDPRNLILTVRGRVGSSDFGGYFITECIFRLLKAKVAALLSESTESRIPQPPATEQTTFEQMAAYFEKHGDAIDKFFPTRSPRRSSNELPVEYTDTMKRAMNLWKLADEIKIKLSASANGTVVINKAEWFTMEIPGLTTEALAQRMRDFNILQREVDRLIERPLQKLVNTCNELVKQKLVVKQFTGISEETMEPEDVHWVVVAGAASRYPLVRKLLQERLRVPFLSAQDAEFRESRMTFDEGNLKNAVAKGLARVLLAKDLQHGMRVTFDSQLAQRLPYDVIYKDAEGQSRILFRENSHVDSMTDTRRLIPESAAQSRIDDSERQARHVLLYRRFPGEPTPVPFLEFRFNQGVGHNITVRYDKDESGLSQDSPFVMVNEDTGEQGLCTDLTPEESFLHPVQRGDL
jgi:molecular chaperone DnaK (HSP70)